MYSDREPLSEADVWARLVGVALIDEKCKFLVVPPENIDLAVCGVEEFPIPKWFARAETSSLGLRYPLKTTEPRQLLGSFIRLLKALVFEKCIVSKGVFLFHY